MSLRVGFFLWKGGWWQPFTGCPAIHMGRCLPVVPTQWITAVNSSFDHGYCYLAPKAEGILSSYFANELIYKERKLFHSLSGNPFNRWCPRLTSGSILHASNFQVSFLKVDLPRSGNFSAWSLMNPCFMMCVISSLRNLVYSILELVVIKIIFVLKKLKIEIPKDPAIPFLGIYKKTKTTNLKRYM